MDQTLTNFIRALRNSEVRISTAETLDAFNAVELVGYEDREFLRRTLSLVLPKTADEKETFDTLLLLMNGTGIFKTLAQTPHYLNHLKKLMNKDGQVLIDSSDIKYMYEDDDSGYWVDLNSDYYGELDYFIFYNGEKEEPMPWLYLDFETLYELSLQAGLKCELLKEGDHYDYLAKLTHL